MAYLLDAAGYCTGMYDGPGLPANSTVVTPPENAAQPLRFLSGAWLLEQSLVSWDTAPAEYWWVDVGSFFDRFGAKALAITSSEDPIVKGLVTLLLPRKYVDLKRPDLPALLSNLVDKGIISNEEVATIVSTPPTAHERHIADLPEPLPATT